MYRNVSRVIKINETSYLVRLELYDEWADEWETLYYTVNATDKAPINKSLYSEIVNRDYSDVTIIHIANKEPCPYPSWRYVPDKNEWEAPVSKPNLVDLAEGQALVWNEKQRKWVIQ